MFIVFKYNCPIFSTQPIFHVLPYTTQGKDKQKNKPVWGLFQDSEGEIWLGGENEAVVFKDNKQLKSFDITKYLSRPYGQVFSLHEMTPGTFLLGIYDDGLLKLDTKSNRIERIKLDMSNIDILSFFKDNDGTMWIGAEYGIYTYKDGVIRKEEDIIRELSDKSIYGILRDRQGRLWMGSYGGRITIFDKDYKVVTRLDHSNGFKTNGINDLFMDSQGGVWAATRNGIGYIKDTSKPEEFELYGYSHGLEDTFVRSIQEDLQGEEESDHYPER